MAVIICKGTFWNKNNTNNNNLLKIFTDGEPLTKKTIKVSLTCDYNKTEAGISKVRSQL